MFLVLDLKIEKSKNIMTVIQNVIQFIMKQCSIFLTKRTQKTISYIEDFTVCDITEKNSLF